MHLRSQKMLPGRRVEDVLTLQHVRIPSSACRERYADTPDKIRPSSGLHVRKETGTISLHRNVDRYGVSRKKKTKGSFATDQYCVRMKSPSGGQKDKTWSRLNRESLKEAVRKSKSQGYSGERTTPSPLFLLLLPRGFLLTTADEAFSFLNLHRVLISSPHSLDGYHPEVYLYRPLYTTDPDTVLPCRSRGQQMNTEHIQLALMLVNQPCKEKILPRMALACVRHPAPSTDFPGESIVPSAYVAFSGGRCYFHYQVVPHMH